MFAYYRKSGVVADVAVMFNLMLQLAFLAAAGATMTLPGVAATQGARAASVAAGGKVVVAPAQPAAGPKATE